MADLRDDGDLRAEIQEAIDDANKAVSRAESIKKFRILDVDWTQEGGHLSAKLGSSAASSPRSSRAKSTRSTQRRGGVRGHSMRARRRAAVGSQDQSRSTQARPFSPMARAARGRSAG